VNTSETKNKYYNKLALPAVQTLDSYPYEIPARLASNFNAALRPEYYYWPQFVKKEYYAYWKLTSPSVPLIISIVEENAGATIGFTSPINNGEHAIDHYEYALSLDGAVFGSFIPFTTNSNQLVLTQLVNGVKYWIILRAVDTENVLGQTSTSAYFTPKNV
jgi:hypothetical protein